MGAEAMAQGTKTCHMSLRTGIQIPSTYINAEQVWKAQTIQTSQLCLPD